MKGLQARVGSDGCDVDSDPAAAAVSLPAWPPGWTRLSSIRLDLLVRAALRDFLSILSYPIPFQRRPVLHRRTRLGFCRLQLQLTTNTRPSSRELKRAEGVEVGVLGAVRAGQLLQSGPPQLLTLTLTLSCIAPAWLPHKGCWPQPPLLGGWRTMGACDTPLGPASPSRRRVPGAEGQVLSSVCTLCTREVSVQPLCKWWAWLVSPPVCY